MSASKKLWACTINQARRDRASLLVSIAFAAMFIAIVPINSGVAGLAETDPGQTLPFVFAGIGVCFPVTLLAVKLFRTAS